jgi:hypothetical protein
MGIDIERAYNHAAIQVQTTDDVVAARRRLTDADGRDTTCCYALQEKIWVHDPDGTPWEIVTVKEQDVEQAPTEFEASASPLSGP